MRSQPAEKEGWKGVLLFQLGVNSRLWDIMNMHMYLCVLVFVYIYRDHCYMNGCWDYDMLWQRDVQEVKFYCVEETKLVSQYFSF